MKWGWYATRRRLAGGDYLKMETYGKENVHKILYFLCHESDFNKLQENLRKGVRSI